MYQGFPRGAEDPRLRPGCAQDAIRSRKMYRGGPSPRRGRLRSRACTRPSCVAGRGCADDSTVQNIDTAASAVDRRYLWNRLSGLRVAIESHAVLSLSEAISAYVEAISDQRGDRMVILMSRTGLGGRDSITGTQAGRRLGGSYQRIHQLERQLHRRRDCARPPAGVWMPQIGAARRSGWPDNYTNAGLDGIRSFFM